MNWKYKAVMFLTLLIFCIGGVCAADADNITVVDDVNTVEDTVTISKEVECSPEHPLRGHPSLPFSWIPEHELNKDINELNTTVNNQSVKINELNNTINNQSVVIDTLKADNKTVNDTEIIVSDDSESFRDYNNPDSSYYGFNFNTGGIIYATALTGMVIGAMGLSAGYAVGIGIAGVIIALGII